MTTLPFHPLINAWFAETYGAPTPVQEEAWPLIAEGAHVLALAPTGSGKTLTGFLAAISRFAEGVYDAERLSVLYVSPLKALNEDIRRNLILPLEAIRARFEAAGEPFPAIRVETRSGDTPQSERRRFLLRPPSILALTPESLGIILLNPRGRQVLSTVRFCVLDEIHAALGSKRGCFLSCQIDRLALIAGEFQRVALSATVKPPEAAADFAGGLLPEGKLLSTGKLLPKKNAAAVYQKRKVHIVSPNDKKELRLKVIYPGKDNDSETPGAAARYGKRYVELIKFIIERIRTNEAADNGQGAVLVFTDSRRRAERIAFLLNQAAADEKDGRPLAYCHHGSLSKEVRREVEKALAAGTISCVVATGSLELGIDIGSVREVILAGSPGSAATALQRVGRSGHGVGMTSRGWLFPFHGMDLLQAAAVSAAAAERELEETASIENPLDLLAQIILALTTEREWHEDELYETLRGFYVYQNLSRASYDGVVRMLAGAYEGTRLRELKRQIFRDDETKTLTAAPGALILLYTSGGVITSRGHYSLRLAPGTEGAGTKIGELDEEFVWERRLGDCFDFGNRSWKITKIGDEAVEAIPLSMGADNVPFWHGETIYRGVNISRRILELLEGYYPKGWTSLKAEKMLDNFSGEAREELEHFLRSQWSFQQGNGEFPIPLPGPAFIPVEIIDDNDARGDAYLAVFHSFRGGGVNYPLSQALAQDCEERYGLRFDGAADDNAVFLRIPRSIAADPAQIMQDSLRRLCESGKGEICFRERLESTGIFGAAFREAAERSLILPRSPWGKRIPLWVTRQKSKRLFDAVSRYRDFPVSAEAWRTCLKEQFDMAGFNSLLEDIGSGAVVMGFFKTRQASPFSKELSWAETNALMYQYDDRPDLMGPPSQGGAGPSLSDRVIAEALGSAAARPPLMAELVGDFCSRLRREIPGWAPEESLTLCEWVKERTAIPDDEWERLVQCIPLELAEALREDRSLGGKLEYARRSGTGVVVHREWAKKWKAAGRDREECLAQWLRFQGPVPPERIADVFGFSPAETEEAIRALQGSLAVDVVVEGSAPFVYTGTGLVCDRENLELLLRLGRRKQRPIIRERPARLLVPFLARRQGLLNNAGAGSARENSAAENAPFQDLANILAGIPAPAKLWETEFFPCRCPLYSAELLDKEIRDGRLLWYGTGKEKTAFCRPEDLELVLPGSLPPPFSGRLPAGFFDTPRSFWEIKDALGAEQAGINAAAMSLWDEVWKGGLTADSWEPARRALANGFASLSEEAAAGGGVTGRRAFRVPRAIRERWRAGPPVRGNWFSLADDASGDMSLLEEEELNRDRLRLLLDRWGVLSRPLLEREVPLLSWSRLLPAMRRLELAGELVVGRFFGGIASLQFASPRIAGELEEADAERGIYWMNAADPASPAGLDIEGIDSGGARRVPSSRLCCRGAELLALSNKGGKELEIFISADDPDIAAALAFVKFPRTRRIQPENKITIEKINGKTAAASAYCSILTELGFVKDRGKLVLW